jgi:predicted AAA+ superfamily ATPase
LHAQLAALAELAETPTELHFYRTHSQEEVDFVLVRAGGIIGIELKNGATVRNSDAAALESMKEQFPKEFRFGVVLYRGNSVIPLSAHAVAVPLSAFFGE